jgi:DnaJ family protein C protein 14
MARKGNQQKNGLDRRTPEQKKGAPTDSGSGKTNSKGKGKGKGKGSTAKVSAEEISNSNQSNKPSADTSESIQLEKDQSVEINEQPVPCDGNLGDSVENITKPESTELREEHVRSPKVSLNRLANGLHGIDTKDSIESFSRLIKARLRDFALSTSNASFEWLEKQKPAFMNLMNKLLIGRDYVRVKFKQTYPAVLKWGMQFGKIMILLFMVWLDCALRGIDSFVRMGTTSLFAVIWFSLFSVLAMIGITKFLVLLTIVALVGFLVGITFAILLVCISGVIILWFYGSFWTTALFISLGGMAFLFSHERIALVITTVYSVYCAWMYVGWSGLALGLNLSFFSSDALIFFLKNNMNDHNRGAHSAPEHPPGGTNGRPEMHADTGSGIPTDRSPGAPSTSGSDADITSEDEVVRLLNCTDHYSALGFSKFGDVDVSLLKREYRKKAMLVHPDKNMGNEKAADAFKKLQNAYEVLLDALKRKTYDDELRREELLDYFRRFQNSSQKNGGHAFFGSTFARTEADIKDPFGESRRIACRKCGNFHIWFHTTKAKSRARWCQECKDFHAAKDGDGWVEQSSQPFFFGILQKVDTPCAYVCADSKIYDATEWYICQEMRCPVNTHKPSFHVNTSVTSKHAGKGTNSSSSSGQRGMPPNMEENMTEEEFVEWLQNAVQSGIFDNFSGAGAGGGGGDSPSGHGGSSSKSGGKRKKKGKKW